jgi:hypothetical protein
MDLSPKLELLLPLLNFHWSLAMAFQKKEKPSLTLSSCSFRQTTLDTKNNLMRAIVRSNTKNKKIPIAITKLSLELNDGGKAKKRDLNLGLSPKRTRAQAQVPTTLVKLLLMPRVI